MGVHTHQHVYTRSLYMLCRSTENSTGVHAHCRGSPHSIECARSACVCMRVYAFGYVCYARASPATIAPLTRLEFGWTECVKCTG